MPAKYYVYTLAYPDGKVFYVGKGSKSRIRDHEREAKSGNCVCRKCIIIRGIWKSGREVKQEVVLEATSSQDALRHERRLIGELSALTDLCNKNHKVPRSEVVKTVFDMPLDDAMSAINQMRLSEKQRKQLIDRWASARLPELRQRWKTARQQHWYDRVAEIEREIESINVMVGNVFQITF